VYVGLSINEANGLAFERSETVRTVQQDGRSLVVTLDRRPGRVNFVIIAGRIVQACRE
jgi:hypothetical protein